MHYDVIVVGAGPAGAAAAYDTARAGLNTLLLDKQAFPRFKPCAGGVTIKALNRLRYSIRPVVQYLAHDLRVSQKLSRTALMTGSSPVCAMTVRAELDAFCRQRALEQGAEWQQVTGLEHIDERDDGVTLTTRCGHQWRARYLIGADGAHSQVRRMTAGFKPDRTAVAMEALVPWRECAANTPMTFDFGVVGKGYAWLFPKGDHVNVGLYTRRPDQFKLSRSQLAAYAAARLDTDKLEHVCGYPIATGGEFYQPARARVFLAGDAAGMAEPLLGEGIHNAIHSGQVVADAVITAVQTGQSALLRYRENLQPLVRDVYNCRRLARVFYGALPLAYTALTRYPTRQVLMNGFAGGKTLTECMRAFKEFRTEFPAPDLYA